MLPMLCPYLLNQGNTYLRDNFGAVPPSPDALVSWLSQLWRNADYRDTVNGRPRLRALLAFCYYSGDLRLYRERNNNVGQGEVMHLRDVPPGQVQAGTRYVDVLQADFAYKSHQECQISWARTIIEESGRVLWRGITKPDGFVAPHGPQGQGAWHEVVTGESACGRRFQQRSIARSVSLSACKLRKSLKGILEHLKTSTTSATRPRSRSRASCCRS